MKKVRYKMIGCLICIYILSFSQNQQSFNLREAAENKKLEIYNRELTIVNEVGHPGINLSKQEGEGVAWLRDLEFSEGTIELEIRGEDLKQHSFVGIAFYGTNNETYDAIYFRPFHFQAQDKVARNKSIQYISLPRYTWRVLRAESPEQYEHSIEPSPDPNSWIKLRLEIKDGTISAFVNDNKKPSLIVKKLSTARTGRIGFYVADTSGGDFSNLSVTKAK